MAPRRATTRSIGDATITTHHRHRWRAAALAALLAGATAACRGPQSALDPAGPAAATIAQGWWLMFWGAVAIWALVVLLFSIALFRRDDARPLARPLRLVAGGGLVLPTVVLAALLVYGTLTSRHVTGSADDVDAVVEVHARQWRWEFRYLDADGHEIARSTDVLAVPLGRMVEYRVHSADVIHSFWIPRLGGKIDAVPGRVNRLRLRADRGGPMRGQCAEYCGRDHARMDFEVRVLSPDAHARFLADNVAGVEK